MGFIKVEKKYVLPSQFEAVKVQFLLHCFVNNIKVSSADLDCLAYITINGYSKDSIKGILDLGIFKTEQSIRNALTKYTKNNLLTKSGKYRIPAKELDIKVDNFIGIDAKFVNLEK